MRPSRTKPYRSLTICWGIRPEERPGRDQSQSTPMVSQHSVEQTIYGTKARFRLTTTVGELRVSYTQKTSPSYEVKDNDIRRAVMAITAVPAATLPESAFLLALGTPALRTVPPQTGSLAQRATEEWERNLCENKAVAILEQMQAGKLALIKKEEKCSLP